MGLNDDRAEVALHPGSMVEVSAKYAGMGEPATPGIVLARLESSWMILIPTGPRGVKTAWVPDSEVFEHVRIQPPEFVLHTKPWEPSDPPKPWPPCPRCGSVITDTKLKTETLQAYTCRRCQNQYWMER